MRKYIIFIPVIIFIISCNSNNEKLEKNYTSQQSNQVFKSEKIATTVSFDDARKFVRDRISIRNGRIIDEFIDNSYGYKIYIFLTEYGSEPCNISVSELDLSILATKCGQDAMGYFYAAKLTSNKLKSVSETNEPINDNSTFSENEVLHNSVNDSIKENQSDEVEFSEYEKIVKNEKYIINVNDNQRVYLHKSPTIETRKNAYFISGEKVIVQKIENGFGYIEFINTRGQRSIGWVEMQYLTKY